MIIIEEINKFNDAQRLKLDWDRIVKENNLSIFQSFDFVMSLWEAWFDKKDIILLLAKEDDRICGIFPLVLDRGTVFKICPVNKITLMTNEFSFFGNNLICDEKINDPLSAIVHRMNKYHAKWDYFEILNMASNSNIWRDTMIRNNRNIVISAANDAAYIGLTRGWDYYIKSKSRKFRQNLRRVDHLCCDNIPCEIKYYNTPEKVDFIMGMIYEIENESWKAREGSIMQSNKKEKVFYETYLKKAAALNNIFCAFLYIQGECAAYSVGIVDKNIFYWLKTSYKNKFKAFSPGNYLYEQLIKKLNELGFEEFNMGNEGINIWHKKYRATEIRKNSNLFICNNHIYSALICRLGNHLSDMIRIKRGRRNDHHR